MPQTPPPAAGETPAAGRVLPLAPSLRRPPPRQPLPDAVAVRRLTVPEFAPPYDDELPAQGQPEDGQPEDGQPEDGRSAGARPASGQPERRTDLTGPGQSSQPGKPGSPGAPRSPGPDQPAAVWPGRFAQVLAETLAGSRPPRQITPWTTEQARRQLRKLGPMLSSAQQPRVRRVLTFSPAADVMELTAVVAFGPRVRALAVRLERDGPLAAGPGREPGRPRWLCTAVESA